MTKVRQLLPAAIEKDDLDAVREEARRRAHALLAEGYRLGENRSHWIIDVRDEADTLVFSMSLADAVAH